MTTPEINDFQLQIFCDNVDHVLFTGAKPLKSYFRSESEKASSFKWVAYTYGLSMFSLFFRIWV